MMVIMIRVGLTRSNWGAGCWLVGLLYVGFFGMSKVMWVEVTCQAERALEREGEARPASPVRGKLTRGWGSIFSDNL